MSTSFPDGNGLTARLCTVAALRALDDAPHIARRAAPTRNANLPHQTASIRKGRALALADWRYFAYLEYYVGCRRGQDRGVGRAAATSGRSHSSCAAGYSAGVVASADPISRKPRDRDTAARRRRTRAGIAALRDRISRPGHRPGTSGIGGARGNHQAGSPQRGLSPSPRRCRRAARTGHPPRYHGLEFLLSYGKRLAGADFRGKTAPS